MALVVMASAQAGLANPPRQVAQGTVPTSVPTVSPAVPSATATPAGEAKEKSERQARAIEFHNEAKLLYERGLYRRAIAKLEAAMTLDPEGKELIYNLALIHEKLAEADLAEGYYRRYLEMETDPKARERTLTVLKRLEGAKKPLKDDIQDRAAPTAAAPTASLAAAAATSAVPAPSGKTAPAPARMPSPMVFVIGGIAVSAVGVGIGFGVSALSMHPGATPTGPQRTLSDLEGRAQSAHTQAIVADLALATSFVVGAAATVLYLLESRTLRSAPSPEPSSAPGSAPKLSAHPRPEAAF